MSQNQAVTLTCCAIIAWTAVYCTWLWMHPTKPQLVFPAVPSAPSIMVPEKPEPPHVFVIPPGAVFIELCMEGRGGPGDMPTWGSCKQWPI